MRTNFAFHRILFLLIGLSPRNVLGNRTSLSVVMLVDEKTYNDTILPAFAIAFERAQKRLDYPMESQILDSKGLKAVLTRDYFQAEKTGQPHLYIGEQTSPMVRTIATLAASKNRLYISLGGNIEQFALDRVAFPTFASSGRGTHMLAALVTQAMKKFKWTRAAVISATDEIHILRARFVKEAIEANKSMKCIPYSHAQSNLTQEDFNPRKNSVKIMFDYLKNQANFFVLLMANKETQFILKYAAEIGMMNGEYAFAAHALVENLGSQIMDYSGLDGLLSIDRPVQTDTETWRTFVRDVQQVHNHTQDLSNAGLYNLKYAGLMYDGFMMWIRVLQNLRSQAGWDDVVAAARDGTKMSALFRSLRMFGVTGAISIVDGMRLANYTLSMLQGENHVNMIEFEADTGKYNDLNAQGLVWPGGGKNPPKERKCFDDSCLESWLYKLILIISGSISGIAVLAFFGVTIVLLSVRFQEKQAVEKWKIQWEELDVFEDHVNANTNPSNSNPKIDGKVSLPNLLTKSCKPTALFRGRLVWIKKINRESVDIFESLIYAELKQVLNVRHDNLNLFLGVCVDAPNVCVVMEHAEKCSLRDVLADPKFEIDREFHVSLAIDIAKGMEYLHRTPVKAHGHLTSANCVIDERWVCKITDYGLKMFRCVDILLTPLLDQLWTAPELLHRKEGDRERVYGTKPGDVYSFGIIMSELLTRQVPYSDISERGKYDELLAKVKLVLDPPFRPTLPDVDEPSIAEWIDLAKQCWQIAPLKRPTFRHIRASLADANSGKFTNVLERMQMVLEESFERANAELTVEKQRADHILQSVVPRKVLQAINEGREFEPQLVKSATLCQCDTTGLYTATRELSAEMVIDALKSLYKRYDEIIENHGAFEVSTLGSKDSMMLGGGLPVNSMCDAQNICAMAVDLLNFVETFSHQFVDASVLKIRISIHTGTVYTSVMGSGIPRFCVYGEAVQGTMNLHASTTDMTIRMSSTARDRLPANTSILFDEAGKVRVKERRPKMMTYLITGKQQQSAARRRSSTRRSSTPADGTKRSSLPTTELTMRRSTLQPTTQEA